MHRKSALPSLHFPSILGKPLRGAAAILENSRAIGAPNCVQTTLFTHILKTFDL